jgi:hypothetical protein
MVNSKQYVQTSEVFFTTLPQERVRKDFRSFSKKTSGISHKCLGGHLVSLFSFIPSSILELINWQLRIHILRPSINPTSQILDLLEPRADQQLQSARGTRPSFAEDDHFLCTIQLR